MLLIIKRFLLENYLLSFFYAFLLLVFFFSYFLKKKFKLKYVYFFENLIYLLVFSYEFNLLYKNVLYWDTGMHTLTGFIVVIFLVFLLKVFLKKIKISKISFWLFSFFGFCFSLTIGVVSELYEYSIDKFFLKICKKII